MRIISLYIDNILYSKSGLIEIDLMLTVTLWIADFSGHYIPPAGFKSAGRSAKMVERKDELKGGGIYVRNTRSRAQPYARAYT